MNYPEKLKIGDTIGICAPSEGIVKEEKIRKLEEAIKQLKEIGYSVIETPSVRKCEKGRSASGEQRARELMELLENPEVKLILFATSGDFLVEILDYLDWEKIRKLPPKWMQGYSDITGLDYVFTTLLEIPTMYCQTVKDYAMRPLYRNLTDAFRIMQGEEIKQNSFEKCISLESEEEDTPFATYPVTENVEWKNIKGEDKIVIEGRAIGGCFDILTTLWGTKYDNTLSYMEKYKKDGIIWFLECFEMGTAEVYRRLWQMKNMGYFKNCTGIIFGRPLFTREDYEISYQETILDAIGDLNIPIIMDADIGHVSPQMAIVNGAVLKISSEKGKGVVETFLK